MNSIMNHPQRWLVECLATVGNSGLKHPEDRPWSEIRYRGGDHACVRGSCPVCRRNAAQNPVVLPVVLKRHSFLLPLFRGKIWVGQCERCETIYWSKGGA